MRSLLMALMLAASPPALAVGPTDPCLQAEPDYRDAERLIALERYAEANAPLTRLDKTFPHEPEVLNGLGCAHRKLKDHTTAKRFHGATLEDGEHHRQALEHQGMWFIETGDIASARANREKLRRICAACEETKDLEEALSKVENDDEARKPDRNVNNILRLRLRLPAILP